MNISGIVKKPLNDTWLQLEGVNFLCIDKIIYITHNLHMQQRKIIHVDMDCFYAAVECKYDPSLKGKPLGIGGPPNSRSVLCTASYEARKFGVRSAMPSSQAVRLCPQLIIKPPRFELYKKESQRVREIFQRYTQIIEPLSLDEAYLDVTDCKLHQGSATKIAYEIRKAIFEELHLTASAGIAPNKFLAKVASDWNKPNGQFVIPPYEVDEFIKKLPVQKIFGVGKVTAEKLHQQQIFNCEDIQKKSIPWMVAHFGSHGESLYALSFGKDEREVQTSWERKSLTVEETFSKDLISFSDSQDVITEIYQEWNRRMNKNEEYKNTISGHVVKIKFSDFRSTTHEVKSNQWPTLQDFMNLLENVWNKYPESIRLIGLGVRLNERLAKEKKKLNHSQLSFL